MAGLYDFPGEFAMRFDGIDAGEWCGSFASWNHSEGSRTASLHKVRISRGGPAGSRAEVWLMGGQPRNLLIEKVNRAGKAVARWRVRNARALKLSGRTTRNTEVAIEKIELVHEHITRVQ